MRIISGNLKGIRLGGKKVKARPTTDFAKESLFNILNNYFYFDKIKVLELFAGTGSISMEFASRGCNNIELVELDYKNFKTITESVHSLGLKQIRIIKGDAFKFIETCVHGYDIIFADPPYDMEGVETLPFKIFERQLLNENGWFILEHSKKHDFQKHPNFKEMRKYGAVHFSIFIN